MTRPLINIDYDKHTPDDWHKPMHQVEDPEVDLDTKACQYYYQVCQMLLDAGRLTRTRTIYVVRLVELIAAGIPQNPGPGVVDNYLQLTAALCYQLGLDTDDLQRAGIPIHTPPEHPAPANQQDKGRIMQPGERWKHIS